MITSNGVNKKYLLQLGLAFTLLYAGISALLHPYDWIGFVPDFVKIFPVGKPVVLLAHSIGEIVLGLWILSNWKIRRAAALTAADILVIILVNGLSALPITFRDIGLLFMAIHLAATDE